MLQFSNRCIYIPFPLQLKRRPWKSSPTSSSWSSRARSARSNWRFARMRGQCIRRCDRNYGRLCVASTRKVATSSTVTTGTWWTRWGLKGLSTEEYVELTANSLSFSGIWHHRATGQADHVATICGLETLPAISPDAKGWRRRGPHRQCVGLRLSPHHVQSHTLPDHGHSIALYVR